MDERGGGSTTYQRWWTRSPRRTGSIHEDEHDDSGKMECYVESRHGGCWSSAKTPPRRRSPQVTGQSRQPPRRPRISATMAVTGHAALRNASSIPRHEHEILALTEVLPATSRGRCDEKWWEEGWLHCAYHEQHRTLATLRRTQQRLYGNFNLQALLEAPALEADVLQLQRGIALIRKDFPALLHHGITIGDVLQVEWQGPDHVRFQSREHRWPMIPATALQFRPALLLPQNSADELQPRPPSFFTWRVRDTNGIRHLVYEPVIDVQIDVGTVRTVAAATRLARRIDPQLVRFDPHPLLDAYAPIWTNTELPSPLRPSWPAATKARGLAEVHNRTGKVVQADALIGTALHQISWQRVVRLPASASRQRLLFHKIKGLRLSGWDRSNNRRGCPHCPRQHGHDLGHTFHIMWHCPAAQVLWNELQVGWLRLGASSLASNDQLCTSVFSLTISQTPSAAWSVLGGGSVDPEHIPLVHSVVSIVWQQQVLGCLQQIWRWRHGVVDEDLPWTLATARSALRGSLRVAYAQAAATLPDRQGYTEPLRRMLHGLRQLQLSDTRVDPATDALCADRFLLFFDGGSRGNPGPGGADAVIVRVDAFGSNPHLVWAAAISLASPTTTNNQAEYTGLIIGLSYAARQRLRSLAVVGDSAMIISQLNRHRAPKNVALRQLYVKARVKADQLGITQWHHHLRAYNKMADWAANLAMNTKSSVQTSDPLTRSCWHGIAAHLQDDVAQWQVSTYPDQTSSD